MNFYKEVFLKLKKQSGLMSKAICEKAGVSRSALWQWEKGITVPNEMYVYKLAESIGVPVDKISDLKPLYREGSDITNESKNILEMFDTRIKSGLIQNLEGHLTKVLQYKDIIQDQNMIMNTVINSINLPLYIKDSEQKYIFINKEFKDVLKLNENFIVYGKKDEDFLTSKVAKMNYDIDATVLRTGKPIKEYASYYLGSSKNRIARSSKFPIYDHNDVIIGIIGFQYDITEEKRNKEKAEILYYLLGELKDAIHVRELRTGKLIYISKSFEKMLGVSIQDFYKIQKIDPLGYIKWLHPDDQLKEKIYWKSNSFPEKSRFRFIRPNGECRWIERNATIKKINERDCLVTVGRDITEEVLKDEKHLQESELRYSLLNHFSDKIGQGLFIGEYKNKILDIKNYIYKNKIANQYLEGNKSFKSIIASNKYAETVKMMENADFPCIMIYNIIDRNGEEISVKCETWISLMNNKKYVFSRVKMVEFQKDIYYEPIS